MHSWPAGTAPTEAFSLNYYGFSYALKLKAPSTLNFWSKKKCEYQGWETGNACWHKFRNFLMCVPENVIGSDSTLKRDSDLAEAHHTSLFRSRPFAAVPINKLEGQVPHTVLVQEKHSALTRPLQAGLQGQPFTGHSEISSLCGFLRHTEGEHCTTSVSSSAAFTTSAQRGNTREQLLVFGHINSC